MTHPSAPTQPPDPHSGAGAAKAAAEAAAPQATAETARRGAGEKPQSWGERLIEQLPESWRHNAELNLFGLTQVPMIFYCRPKIVRIDDEICWVDIPLSRRTRNHFRSMYFGALAVGADVAGGFLARHHIMKSHHKLSLIFKSYSAEFLKRPQADVRFVCEDGAILAAMVDEANATGERVTRDVSLVATCPSIDPGVAVARFTLEVSIKRSAGGRATGEH